MPHDSPSPAPTSHRPKGTSRRQAVLHYPPSFCEPATLAAKPLVPLRPQHFQQAENEPGSMVVSDQEALAWRICMRRDGDGCLPGPEVLDVWVLLLALYADQGYPKDGKVTFGRAELVRQLGWVRPSVRPGGEQYRRLARAFHHLQAITLEDSGGGGRATQVQLVVHSELRDDPAGRAKRGAPRQHRSTATLHGWVVSRLQPGARGPERSTAAYFALPGGSPRALYRQLLTLREEGRTTITPRELLARLGSHGSRSDASDVKALLDDAHRLLARPRGLLAKAPEYLRLPGTRGASMLHIVYTFRGHRSDLTPTQEAVLARALALGMWPNVASKLAREHEEDLTWWTAFFEQHPERARDGRTGRAIYNAVMEGWRRAEVADPHLQRQQQQEEDRTRGHADSTEYPEMRGEQIAAAETEGRFDLQAVMHEVRQRLARESGASVSEWRVVEEAEAEIDRRLGIRLRA